MNTKVIVKQLAAEEDLLLGEGQITQTRNGQAVTVTKLTLFKIVSSDAELQAIDTSKFKHAMLIENGFGQSYYFNGGSWMPLATTGGQVVSAVPPSNPVNGTRWFDTTSGRTYIYYVDVDSAQWVEDNPQNRTIVVGGGGGGAVTSVNGDTGDVTVQEVLVSGTNLKTINGESLLGAGNIVVGGGGGGGATNLTYTASPTQGIVVSDTGTDATIPAGSTTNASLMLPADKTKLNGIEAGAEVNAVDSVFGRSGPVVATSGDYSSAQVSAAASATNYTPAAATVEGHLAGIDAALASGGGGSGGIMFFKNTNVFSQNGISTAFPGTIIDLGNASMSLAINTISGASFNPATDAITLPSGTYTLQLAAYLTRAASPIGARFQLVTVSGFDVSSGFGLSTLMVSGVTLTMITTSIQAITAFTAGASTTFTVNVIASEPGTNLVHGLSGGSGNTFALIIEKVA